MCGIAGFVSRAPLVADEASAPLARMIERLRHRGPDDAGSVILDHVALGHTRLTIIDTSTAGRQPMPNEDSTIHVVFNGEIYNFPALRERLVEAGHVFRSRCDTEVIPHGYEQWGLAGLLDRLEGMYAFALWDAGARRLVLARDPFGIKPLFYTVDAGGLVFASEPKALVARDGVAPPVDPCGLVLCLQHFASPAPRSIHAGYRQLEPGAWLSYDAADGKLEGDRHWSWRFEPEIDDPEEADRLAWEAMCRSAEKHLLADVPVGLFLSGGLDSSLVAAACVEVGARPECLTIGIDQPSKDESANAAMLARHFGLPHRIERMGEDVGREFDPALADVFDEPYNASAALSAAYICRTAAASFKVMLSGEGGDELFGGYRWHADWLAWYGRNGRAAPGWRHPFNAMRGALGRKHRPVDPIEGYAEMVGAYRLDQLRQLFDAEVLARCGEQADGAWLYRQADAPHLRGFDRVQHWDANLFLPNVCLTKMDRTSMAYGLEVRVPLLDRVLAELVGRVAPEVRNPGGRLKGMVKRIARGRLPEALLDQPKRGFSTPTRRWFPKDAIVSEIGRDMEDDWWRGVFSPRAAEGAAALRGERLWRFWHVWRWVRERGRGDG